MALARSDQERRTEERQRAFLPRSSAFDGVSAVLHQYRLPLLLALPTAAAVSLLLVPVLVLLRYSFYTHIPGRGLIADATLANYVQFFSDGFFRGSLGITIGTAVLVTALSLLLAFPMAYVYARTSFGPKGLLLLAILSPFYIEVLVKIYAWMVLLGRTGPVNNLLRASGLISDPINFLNSYLGILIILVYVTLPFMILSLIGPLQGVDETLVEAARVCGSPPSKVFRTIVLPLSIPGVIAGCILVFSVGISTFIVPLIVGGRIGQQFLAVVVYSSMNLDQNWALGSTAATILLVFSLGVVLLYNWVVRSLRVGAVVRESVGN